MGCGMYVSCVYSFCFMPDLQRRIKHCKVPPFCVGEGGWVEWAAGGGGLGGWVDDSNNNNKTNNSTIINNNTTKSIPARAVP